MPTNKPIQTVAIISKRATPGTKEGERIIRQIYKFFKKQKKDVFLDTNANSLFPDEPGHHKDYLLRHCDLAVVLGGDGTLLKTARRLSRKKVLILGVNMGNLGFLTETEPNKLIECLNTVCQGSYHVDRRSLLRVTLYRKGKKINTFLALNDAVINQGSFARLVEMDLEADGRKIVKFKADGIIVSTPTGSTAHSLSAGGPIVHPHIESFILTPICPSSLSMRPIVIPDKKQIKITIVTHRREESAKVGLTLDGQDVMELKYGDQIKIRKSSRILHLVRTKHRYYRMLRKKLNWGDL